MSLSKESVYEVVEHETITELGERIAQVGEQTHQSMLNTDSAWSNLPQYFQVSGAEGAYDMMHVPVVDAASLMLATEDLRFACQKRASKFKKLQNRRAQLLARIEEVNKALTQATDALESESLMCYDTSTEAGFRQQHKLWGLEHQLEDAQYREERLREDIRAFNEDVLSEEQQLATLLTGVEGGTKVHGADGKERSSTKTSWGRPGSAMSDTPLVSHFQRSLTAGVLERLDTISQWDAQELEAWALEHPEFIAAVGLAQPWQMQRWYEGITSQPRIATLFTSAAPGIIGNMNGLPSDVKDSHNRRYLSQLLSDDALATEDRERLNNVEAAITDLDGTPLPDSSLLSLFLDSSEDHEPRADVAYGDVDTADLVVTLSHGINTDLKNFPSWAATGEHLQQDLVSEAERRGYQPEEGRSTAATIVTFGYDSKGAQEVQEMPHADAGAMRYNQLMNGINTVNPSASTSGWFHSYGTTKGAEAAARSPDMLDQMYTIGSAGWTEEAAEAIGDSDVQVYSTAASKDWTAWMGRTSFLSHHSVNPVDLDYTTVISSEGGTVDFGIGADGTPHTVEGKQTEGHSSHHHKPWYEFNRSQQGYLQPDSQAYLEGVNVTVDLLVERR